MALEYFYQKAWNQLLQSAPNVVKLGGWEEMDPGGETDKLDISDSNEMWAGLGVEFPQAPAHHMS